MAQVKLALSVAFVGFVFTSQTWLNFLGTLGPEVGLVVKGAAILLSVLFIDKIDPSIHLIHQQYRPIDIILVYGALALIFGYSSKWVKDSGSHHVTEQTVDGAVYDRVQKETKLDPQKTRLVTFVLLPFMMVLLGIVIKQLTNRY